MPHRNSRERSRAVRDFHVYNRQRDRDPIFRDDEDRRTFLWMISRYLTPVPQHDLRGRAYRNLRGHVEVLAFALMLNHFHLVIRQLRPGGLRMLMNGAMSSYVRYFNAKYGEDGSMFGERYRAAEKSDRRSLLNAISYVHDNHAIDCGCEFCSHRFYADPRSEVPSWLAAETGLQRFGGHDRYLDYREMRRGMSIIAD
jgi:hypothetical protein